MRRRTKGVILPAVVLSTVASVGVVTILLGAGTLPDQIPTLRVHRDAERRSTSVTTSPTPKPTASRTPSVSPTAPPTREPSGGPTSTRTSSPPTKPPVVTPPSCKAGSTTVRAAADTYVDQANPKRAFGSDDALTVTSRDKGRNRRALVRFALPVVPKGCTVRSATLTLTPSQKTGRKLLVSRASKGWNEGTTWSTAPSPSGYAVAATVSGGPVRWNVTSLLSANGFVVRDAAENAHGAGATTNFAARQTGSYGPTLTVVWG